MRFINCLLLSFIVSIFFSKPVYADENFDIEYDIFYRVIDSKTTQVTQTTSLINKKTNLYPTEFELNIRGGLEGDITGFDSTGNLEISSQKMENNSYKIKVKLIQVSAGINNKITFSLNYKLNNLVTTIGRVYEINIPKPADDPSVVKYSVRASITKQLGPVGFIKPEIDYQETDTSYFISFNQNQAKKGILVGIGEASHFKFKLTYHLSNDSIIPKKYDVALPPDTSFQDVYYENIEPYPISVIQDDDGNWLATYLLSPKQSIDVMASGSALIYAKAKENFDELAPNKEHTKPDKFWESDNTTVKSIGNLLKTPEDIYNYLTTNLHYNYKKVNSLNRRAGAAVALNNPDDAICMEFTDSFIALARLQNIPTREVNGFAYTSDEFIKPLSLVADVLHSWPEYWDNGLNRWIPVDPTWGSTTLGVDYFNSMDFNHFTFVRRGISSIYPLAAGSYRAEDKGKNVEVTVQADLPRFPQKNISFTTTQTGSKLKLSVTNNSGKAWYNINISLLSKDLIIEPDKDQIDLLPFSKKDIIISYKPKAAKFWGSVPVVVIVDDKSEIVNLKVSPKEVYYLIIILPIFLFLLIILTRKFRKYVQKSRT